MDQIFRGAPNSPVSLLNKASICSTGLTPKVSENLSSTTFTINKDNSLTLTPVPIPPVTNRAYNVEPRYHRVEFTPRSTPGLENGNGTLGSESVVGDEGTQQWREQEVTQRVVRAQRTNGHEEEHAEDGDVEQHVVDGREEEHVSNGHEDGKECERDGGSGVGGTSATDRGNGFRVFVPKAHKTYEEHVPNMYEYVDPERADSRCSLKSPSSFRSVAPEKPKPNVVIQERSLPVRALIDSFEHNGRPVMRYLQLDESIPLSDGIRRLHDEPPRSLATVSDGGQEAGGFYTADAVVETRSFVYGTGGGHAELADEPPLDEPPVDEPRQACAEGSGATDRSEYGDTDDASVPPFEVRADLKFQTIRQLATPDSLESSMLFAHKHTPCDRDNGTAYYGAPPPLPSQTKVTGKTNAAACLCSQATVPDPQRVVFSFGRYLTLHAPSSRNPRLPLVLPARVLPLRPLPRPR